ncbi:flagellar biosynthesis anti-sigma factor FlgM [Terriglobus sp.]|uniref:flagellar biosynthesis anti-sigma factor FlgM n=1 Tax=Terriglobus sp. TaxID=1889013 RepID=UPI003AFFA12A
MSYTSGVTSSPLLQTLLTQADSVGQPKAGRTNTAGITAAQDSAQLSTVASALQQTTAEDPARAEKVRSVQAAIANGTYDVSASAVADKLMQSLLQR